MHAYVVLRDPDGRDHELVPGDLVGRVWSAALQIADGRVSEAHGMVSLREGQLQLIGLRGGFAVGGAPVAQVTLTPGLRVELARGLWIEVIEVSLPEHTLGIEGPGLPRQALPGVASVLVEPALRLAQGWREDARAQVWTTGDRWLARVPGAPPREVGPGDTLAAGDIRLTFVEVALRAAGPAATRRQGEVDAPLRVVARWDTAHVHRDGAPVLVFGGKQARLLSELVTLGGPIGWGALSETLWPEEPDPALRRSRLDVLISRVRRRLRAAGVRADLVHTDGSGQVELLVYARDRVEDET